MKLSKLIFLIVVVIGVVGVVIGGYAYYQSRSSQNTAQKNLDEAKQLVAEVGKIMLLPSDETPTIATVSDVGKLGNQAFFKYAKNGNKILIYTKARMAILYDQTSRKIINVGPVNVGDQPNQAPQAKISLLNGTSVEGLAGKEQANIQKAFPGATVVKVGQATSTTYAKTVVIALNPLAKEAAQMLATFYSGAVVPLPSTESPQDGIDVIVILGKDRDQISGATPSPTKTPAEKK